MLLTSPLRLILSPGGTSHGAPCRRDTGQTALRGLSAPGAPAQGSHQEYSEEQGSTQVKYVLTAMGQIYLDLWVEVLRATEDRLHTFVIRYKASRMTVTPTKEERAMGCQRRPCVCVSNILLYSYRVNRRRF